MKRFELQFPDANAEKKWEQFRIWRRAQLSISDWVFAADCSLGEEEKNKIIQYRAFIKNAPENFETVEQIVFPGYMGILNQNFVYIEEPYSIQRHQDQPQ